MRFLSKIRDHLSWDLTSRLCTSIVLSRLDYCNYIVAGLPKCSLWPLHLAQSMEAHLIFRARMSCHIAFLIQHFFATQWTHGTRKFGKLLLNRRTGYVHHTFRTLLTRKLIFAPLGQLMATVLQPRFSNCVRSVTDLIAQWDLDCEMTFHYAFVIGSKFAQRQTKCLILCSCSFLYQGRLLLWPLICLACSTKCCVSMECRLSHAYRKPVGYRKLSSVQCA